MHRCLMEAEVREAPGVVRRQIETIASSVTELAVLLKKMPPSVVMTCARGSSANAACFGKHLVERYLGVPVAAVAPSIVTLYRRRLFAKRQLFITISQSGCSDDLVECAASAKASGALTVAIVNDTASPLASNCDIILPVEAGLELSVAATKTFIGSVSVLLNVVAAWAGNNDLRAALDHLPDSLESAGQLDWSEALSVIAKTQSLVVLGRGPTLAMAQEASLKLKEICNIHAEAFSGAEFQHGHIALVSRSYPILIFMPTDAAATGLVELGENLSTRSDCVFMTGHNRGQAARLSALSPVHPAADAVCLIQSFYVFALHLARHLGIDVDQPRHITKITRTI